ncbi:MAG: PorP/SprF family type IX secretion system membrane protein [Bacteroidetes bacterium]|nr:PorP/SprF family type IX secretion system membrane protein [Bacteroidota bacterium]MBU1720247.1 PorP/SprF family type IX secretion system membrane protein [Bacteroidota bacterium]
MRQRIITYCLVIAAVFAIEMRLFAQDIHFSQLFNQQLSVNPAACGDYNTAWRVNTGYRQQWGSVSNNPFVTNIISLERSLLDRKLNTGIIFFKDIAGASQLRTLHFDLVASSRVMLFPKHFVSAGIQVGFGQRRFNTDELVWDSQYEAGGFNPLLPSNEKVREEKFGYGDLAAGFTYRFDISGKHKINAGFGLYHINTPVFSFIRDDAEDLAMKYTIQFTYRFKPDPASRTTWLGVFNTIHQKKLGQWQLGAICEYDLLPEGKRSHDKKSPQAALGLILRTSDAIAPYLGLHNYDGYSIGITYDINFSDLKLASVSRGGLELSVRYNFDALYKKEASQAQYR